MNLSELRFNGRARGRIYHLHMKHSGETGITAVIYDMYQDGSIRVAYEQEFPNARTWETPAESVRSIMRRHI